MQTTTFDIVEQILTDRFSHSAEPITFKTRIESDLGADSLDIMELAMALEYEFALEVRPGDAENLETVGDIINLVDARLN